MKYIYFFLMSALTPSLSQTMNYTKSSTHIPLHTQKQKTGKQVKLSGNKKSRIKQVPLDSHGIDGTCPSPRINKKFTLTVLSKTYKI